MRELDLTEMENIEGGSWSCISGVGGLVTLGIAMSVSIPVVGTLAWGGMMLGAFFAGGSLGHCGYSLTS
jgi:hypothetical protein